MSSRTSDHAPLGTDAAAVPSGFAASGGGSAGSASPDGASVRAAVRGGGRARLGAVVVVAALALAACGSNSGGGSSATEPAAALGSGAVAGTLTVWAQGTEGESLPAAVKAFEAANPGVKVNITAVPWASAHNKYQTAIAGGSTPDVAQMGTTWMADFASAFDPTPSELDTSGMFEGAKSATKVNGTTYGVPWYVDTRVIYYRTDLAKKAGYDTPPATWDDFKAMAKAMQTKAGAKWGVGLPSSGTDSFQAMLPFVWSNGASLMDSEGKNWTFNTPQMVSALQDYQSFFTDGIADKNPPTGAGAAESAFVSGETPMLIAGPSEIGSLNQAGGANFADKYSVMQIPKKVSSTSFVGGSDLVVFKKTQNRVAAWKLVQFLTQPAVQTQWYKAAGDLPSVQSAWNDPSLGGDRKLAVFQAQLKDVKSPPANTGWTQVSAAADTQLEKIVKTGASPAEAMKTLQSSADSIGTGG